MRGGSPNSKCTSRKSGGIGGREHGKRQAQAWLAQGLKAAGIKAADLESVKRQTRSAANASLQMRRLDKERALGRVPEARKRSLEGWMEMPMNETPLSSSCTLTRMALN